MGRIYHIPFSAVAVSAAQDLFEALAVAGKPFTLNRIVVGQISDVGDAAAENLMVTVKRATAGYTTGSGGSTVTPRKRSTGLPAAGITSAKLNNTTPAVAGTGTLEVLLTLPFNIADGVDYEPEKKEDRLVFAPTEACIVGLTAPADALTMSGTMIIEEYTSAKGI